MQARRLTAAQGVAWLAEGFDLYRANPFLLISLTLGYLFLLVFVNLIPIIGTVAANLSLPFLVVMVANGCRAIDRGYKGPLPSSVLLAGLKSAQQMLVLLGGLNLLGSVLALLLGLGISTLLNAPTQVADHMSLVDLLLLILPPMIFGMPVFAAFWFAPLLTAWDGISPIKSLFFSLVACVRNWLPLAAFFGVATFAGMVMPAIVFGLLVWLMPFAAGFFSALLGLLIMFLLAPVLMTSIYVGYRDIFINA
ncbi:MAG: BPSS1780 family membrane protein [Zoogloea sp.]|uniref:BPSS1780 family membrane protein n=1 Tax=Zoogloea sp. TaxID=49181 RepID=UPI003F3641B5